MSAGFFVWAICRKWYHSLRSCAIDMSPLEKAAAGVLALCGLLWVASMVYFWYTR